MEKTNIPEENKHNPPEVWIDTLSNYHPYECGGDCIHCRREKTDKHDPDHCALCQYT